MTPDEKLKVLLKQGRGIEPRPGFEEAVWSRIHAASELATLEHIRRVSVLLTSDQRKKFLSDLTGACVVARACVRGDAAMNRSENTVRVDADLATLRSQRSLPSLRSTSRAASGARGRLSSADRARRSRSTCKSVVAVCVVMLAVVAVAETGSLSLDQVVRDALSRNPRLVALGTTRDAMLERPAQATGLPNPMFTYE